MHEIGDSLASVGAVFRLGITAGDVAGCFAMHGKDPPNKGRGMRMGLDWLGIAQGHGVSPVRDSSFFHGGLWDSEGPHETAGSLEFRYSCGR